MDASIYDTDSFIKDFESCVNDQLKVFNVLVDSIQSFGVVPVKFLNDFLDNIIPNDNTKYIDLLLPIVKNFYALHLQFLLAGQLLPLLFMKLLMNLCK